jgi:hypothetical protein
VFTVDVVEASLAKSGKGSKGPVDDLSAYRKAPVIVRARTPNVHADNKVRCHASQLRRHYDDACE